MKLTFIGADHEVTGSCHYLEACGKHILVDYGMEQGVNIYENAPLPVQEGLIDYVLLTHAHVDHSGMLPLLYARGFRGQVLMTDASADLCSIMLRDCAHIQMQEAEWKNRKAKRHAGTDAVEPVYTMEDADGIIKRIVPCHYDTEVALCEGIRIRFTDIGHLLGSASIEIWISENGQERKIVFSGDIGNKDQPLIKDPKLTAEADYVVMESTYGDRLHTAERPDYVAELTQILSETFAKGGNVVIPSFAVGRTQEMLYFLRKIKADRLVKNNPDFPVYVDSPLAVEATGIFHKNIYSCFDEEAMELVRQGINPIQFPGLHLAITSDESKMINFDDTPKVILSASGMCEAGRIRHHLKHNLWRPECTVLFVGYQVEGTLGRRLLNGARYVNLFGEDVRVAADIENLEGISAHADMFRLVDWIASMKKRPTRVYVNHGSDGVCDSFAKTVTERLGIEAAAPYSGDVFDPVVGAQLTVGSRQKVPRGAYKRKGRSSAVWNKLYAAGMRLMGIIERSSDCKSKELVVLTNRINALCDKQEKAIKKDNTR